MHKYPMSKWSKIMKTFVQLTFHLDNTFIKVFVNINILELAIQRNYVNLGWFDQFEKSILKQVMVCLVSWPFPVAYSQPSFSFPRFAQVKEWRQLKY